MMDALFLGQVRLAGGRIGQTLDPNSPYYDPAAAWEEQIKDLVNGAKNLPDYLAIVQDGILCRQKVDAFRRSPTPDSSTDAKKCISDLEGRIQISTKDAARTPATPAAPSASSTGIPTWGLILGGVVVGAIGGYFISRG